jgi:glycosyltransferase involved in cell wall biosynthesis
VLFGACPAELRPYVKEFHTGACYERYPEALAGLDLELAVAPLRISCANEARGNRRLLEYGVMGWPVVCTDIAPHRACGAPVTRVPNAPAAWIEAIRAHVHDQAASKQAGDTLRAWVERHWILEDHLDDWLDALTHKRRSERTRFLRGA